MFRMTIFLLLSLAGLETLASAPPLRYVSLAQRLKHVEQEKAIAKEVAADNRLKASLLACGKKIQQLPNPERKAQALHGIFLTNFGQQLETIRILPKDERDRRFPGVIPAFAKLFSQFFKPGSHQFIDGVSDFYLAGSNSQFESHIQFWYALCLYSSFDGEVDSALANTTYQLFRSVNRKGARTFRVEMILNGYRPEKAQKEIRELVRSLRWKSPKGAEGRRGFEAAEAPKHRIADLPQADVMKSLDDLSTLFVAGEKEEDSSEEREERLEVDAAPAAAVAPAPVAAIEGNAAGAGAGMAPPVDAYSISEDGMELTDSEEEEDARSPLELWFDDLHAAKRDIDPQWLLKLMLSAKSKGISCDTAQHEIRKKKSPHRVWVKGNHPSRSEWKALCKSYYNQRDRRADRAAGF